MVWKWCPEIFFLNLNLTLLPMTTGTSQLWLNKVLPFYSQSAIYYVFLVAPLEISSAPTSFYTELFPLGFSWKETSRSVYSRGLDQLPSRHPQFQSGICVYSAITRNTFTLSYWTLFIYYLYSGFLMFSAVAGEMSTGLASSLYCSSSLLRSRHKQEQEYNE